MRVSDDEADPVAADELGGPGHRRRGHHGDDRIAAGHRMIGEEDDALTEVAVGLAMLDEKIAPDLMFGSRTWHVLTISADRASAR